MNEHVTAKERKERFEAWLLRSLVFDRANALVLSRADLYAGDEEKGVWTYKTGFVQSRWEAWQKAWGW